MLCLANQKRFIGLTVLCLATVIPSGMLVNRPALGQTVDQQAKLLQANLKATNDDRALFQNTPDLTAAAPDAALNTGAQNCAQKQVATNGAISHGLCDADRNGKGENIFVTFTTDTLTPENVGKQAVDAWYSERANYDYSNPGFSATTGHFTQLIWAATTTLGCGYAVGTATIDGTLYNAYYVVCRYDPAGNSGDTAAYTANVNPPKSGTK